MTASKSKRQSSTLTVTLILAQTIVASDEAVVRALALVRSAAAIAVLAGEPHDRVASPVSPLFVTPSKFWATRGVVCSATVHHTVIFVGIAGRERGR